MGGGICKRAAGGARVFRRGRLRRLRVQPGRAGGAAGLPPYLFFGFRLALPAAGWPALAPAADRRWGLSVRGRRPHPPPTRHAHLATDPMAVGPWHGNKETKEQHKTVATSKSRAPAKSMGASVGGQRKGGLRLPAVGCAAPRSDWAGAKGVWCGGTSQRGAPAAERSPDGAPHADTRVGAALVEQHVLPPPRQTPARPPRPAARTAAAAAAPHSGCSH